MLTFQHSAHLGKEAETISDEGHPQGGFCVFQVQNYDLQPTPTDQEDWCPDLRGFYCWQLEGPHVSSERSVFVLTV